MDLLPRFCRGRRAVNTGILSVALVVTGVCGSARAEFGQAITVSPPRAEPPNVGIDAHGGAVMVWGLQPGDTDADRLIQTRSRSASGVLSPIQTLFQGFNLYLQMAVDGDGNAVFVWISQDGLLARARSAAGDLGPINLLSDASSQPRQNDVGIGSGRAVFVWASNANGLESRTLFSDGTLSPVQLISIPDVGIPQAAVNADGNAVFVWPAFDATHYHIQTRTLSTAGVLSPIQTLSGAGPANSPDVNVDVAIDAAGDAVLVWDRFDGTGYRVEARTRSAAGVLGPIHTLSVPGYDPKVAVDADGDAIFAWRNIQPGAGLQTRALSAGGLLSPTQTLSGGDSNDPQVAIDADGNAVFVWTRRVIIGASGADTTIIESRTRSAAGELGLVQILTDPSNTHDSDFPHVAMNADGDAIAVWQTHINMSVAGPIIQAAASQLPRLLTKDDCKRGGWRTFTTAPGPFKNQGQCVSYVARHHNKLN